MRAQPLLNASPYFYPNADDACAWGFHRDQLSILPGRTEQKLQTAAPL